MAVSDAEARANVASRIPQWAWLVDHPEIGPLVLEVGRGTLAIDEFSARLRQTKWFLSTSDTLRQWTTLKKVDPARAKRLTAERSLQVRQFARQFGVRMSGKQSRDFANWTLGNLGIDGISEGQLRAHMGNFARGTGQLPTEFRQNLREVAAKYMVGIPPDQFDWWTRAVASGTRTLQQFEGLARTRAKGKYPALAGLIDQGILPDDYFAGHRQVIAEEMEINPNQINLTRDLRWKKILGINTKEGKRPMTESEVQEYVRGLPDWRKTGRAQQMAADLSLNLLQMFGKKA